MNDRKGCLGSNLLIQSINNLKKKPILSIYFTDGILSRIFVLSNFLSLVIFGLHYLDMAAVPSWEIGL